MSRLSITITMQADQKKGLDYTWQQARRLLKQNGHFCLDELQGFINATQCIETTRGWVASWEKAGYLLKVPETKSMYREGNKKTHVVPRVRRDGTILPEAGQERLWRAMKILKNFSPEDLSAASITENAPCVPLITVKSYLRHLVRTGIVREQKKNSFLLIKNLGGAAPKILRTKVVYDPNNNRIIGDAVTEFET